MKTDIAHYQAIWPSGLFSDVTLQLNDKKFDVHKAILASASPYFLALFTQMKEATQQVIKVSDVDANLFNQALNIIYGQRIEINGLETLRLLVLVQYLQVRNVFVDDIIEEVKIKDLLEYVDLISKLYSGVYSEQFTEMFFEKLLPSFETPIQEIIPLLPLDLQVIYKSINN